MSLRIQRRMLNRKCIDSSRLCRSATYYCNGQAEDRDIGIKRPGGHAVTARHRRQRIESAVNIASLKE